MSQWNFHRRQGSCSACEHEFEDGERHASALFVRVDELAREDWCSGCWEQREAEEGDLFWWFTHYRVQRQATLKLDLDALDTLYRRLASQEIEAARELRYVLCLLLMRKRRLKLERVQRADDGEAMLVRRPRKKDLERVHVFDFGPERLDELRARLQAIFDGVESEDGIDIAQLLAPATPSETGSQGQGSSATAGGEQTGEQTGDETGEETGEEAQGEAPGGAEEQAGPGREAPGEACEPSGRSALS